MTPSDLPSNAPSANPSLSLSPSSSPSPQPSSEPSSVPSLSLSPSSSPSSKPSDNPSTSAAPSVSNAPSISNRPSESMFPSSSPTLSMIPSSSPSSYPSVSNAPSLMPSITNVPGCSGLNDGLTNYCINPTFTEQNIPLTNLDNKGSYINAQPLNLCQGHCEIDDNCNPGLVCMAQDSNGNVDGCTGTSPNEGWKYCTYPSLTLRSVIDTGADSSLSINDVRDSFLRIHNEGKLQVFSKENGLLWDSVDGKKDGFEVCTENNCGFNTEFDVSITTARDIIFAGDYNHVDFATDIKESIDGGLSVTTTSIKVKGTTSKAYEFVTPLQVNSTLFMKFNYTVVDGAKAFALCFDDGITKRVENDGRVLSKCAAIGGSSVSDVLSTSVSLDENIQSTSQNVTVVEFGLSNLFPSQIGKLRYIGILQVMNDNVFTDSFSLIEEPKFFYKENVQENPQRRLDQTANSICVCNSTELASTLAPGLHHTCQAEGDFCTSAKNILTEITKNENDPCLTASECRSGICGDEPNKVCLSEVRGIS